MLNKADLKTGIKNAMLANVSSPTGAQTTEIDNFADALADAIDTFVRGIQITYTTGLANSGGPVTGTFGNTIN